MACPGEATDCGLHRETVKDCVELKWLVSDATQREVYRSTEIVSASGTIQGTSSTTGLRYVTVSFLIGSTLVTSFDLGSKESKAFTVVGFDTITLTGTAVAPSESATGTLCFTPRYELF